jgi:hypothetical protein
MMNCHGATASFAFIVGATRHGCNPSNAAPEWQARSLGWRSRMACGGLSTRGAMLGNLGPLSLQLDAADFVA